MTINTQKLRQIGALLDEGYQINDHSGIVTQAADEIDRLRNMAWTNGDILKESQAEAVKLRGRVIRLRSALRGLQCQRRGVGS